MSVTVAFHRESPRGRQTGGSEVRLWLSERETAHPARCCIARAGERARYDPQSGHDGQGSQDRLSQTGVAFEPDVPPGLIRRKTFGEQLPRRVLIEGDPGRWMRDAAGKEVPASHGAHQGPASSCLSRDLELNGGLRIRRDVPIPERQRPDKDVQHREEPPTGAQARSPDRFAYLLLVQPAFSVLPADVEPVGRILLARPGHPEPRCLLWIEGFQVAMQLWLGPLHE